MSAVCATESIVLYFKEGSSDKEYRASIEPAPGSSPEAGFVVNFAFGRRGSTLQAGTKTPGPVSYDEAKKIYDKLVREKTAKGYAPEPAGDTGDGTAPPAPYQGTPKETRVTGVLPQLLNPIDERQANLLALDSNWWAQQKFDGKRVLIQRKGDGVIGINRSGLVIGLPTLIVEHATRVLGRGTLLDGEAIGDTYVAFDLLEDFGGDLRSVAYRRRYQLLHMYAMKWGIGALRVATATMGTDTKREMIATLRRDRREGVVFKRWDAPYTPGRPASGGPALKFKFTATASCLVVGTNGDKRSVALELFNGTRKVSVGSVTIPGRQPIPGAGSIIEVRYLYAFPSGALFQPVYMDVRDDIAPEACTVAQLKLKASDDEG